MAKHKYIESPDNDLNSFMDGVMKEIKEKMKKDIDKQESIFWGLSDIDKKLREDIENGKPIYFNGFIKLIENGSR